MKIIILEGNLKYNISELILKTLVQTKKQLEVIEPQVLHYITPLSSVRFYIESYQQTLTH